MSKNKSPWLEQIDKNIIFPCLEDNKQSDICIVGAGISGVLTAYQILRQTDLSVVILDANKVGHGASGHNAGQVALYFEKPFQEIVREYSLGEAVDGQKALIEGYDLIEEAVEYIDATDQFEACQGYMGVSTWAQLKLHLENKFLRDAGGAQFDGIMIDREWSEKSSIPESYLPLITFVGADFIREKLESSQYFPVLLTSKKACVNSALLCQKMLIKLQKEYRERLSVYENSPVSEIQIKHKNIDIIGEKGSGVLAERVILCTNGFEKFHILDLTGGAALSFDQRFHKNIHGLVGYMAGFYGPKSPPCAISYYPPGHNTDWREDEYYYVTRRTINETKSLTCVGGPDDLIPHEHHYDPENHNAKTAYSAIRGFLRNTRHDVVPDNFDYEWHGLMGFTHTGLRYIGPHSRLHHLWYNLGCNGVGIVSAAYGAWKIGKMLSGHSFGSSIFDVS